MSTNRHQNEIGFQINTQHGTRPPLHLGHAYRRRGRGGGGMQWCFAATSPPPSPQSSRSHPFRPTLHPEVHRNTAVQLIPQALVQGSVLAFKNKMDVQNTSGHAEQKHSLRRNPRLQRAANDPIGTGLPKLRRQLHIPNVSKSTAANRSLMDSGVRASSWALCMWHMGPMAWHMATRLSGCTKKSRNCS